MGNHRTTSSRAEELISASYLDKRGNIFNKRTINQNRKKYDFAKRETWNSTVVPFENRIICMKRALVSVKMR